MIPMVVIPATYAALNGNTPIGFIILDSYPIAAGTLTLMILLILLGLRHYRPTAQASEDGICLSLADTEIQDVA